MRHLRTYESETETEFDVDDYVLISNRNFHPSGFITKGSKSIEGILPKPPCDDMARISKKLSWVIDDYKYYITYNNYNQRWILQSEIKRLLTEEEIELYKIGMNIKKFNL